MFPLAAMTKSRLTKKKARGIITNIAKLIIATKMEGTQDVAVNESHEEVPNGLMTGNNALGLSQVKTLVPATEVENELFWREDPTLEIGTINLKLCVPGLLNMIIPIPTLEPNMSVTTWSKKLYDEFRFKYWIKVPCGKYRCLLCGRQFRIRDCLVSHLNRHMGFKVARCLICKRQFYSVVYARKHAKICQKVVKDLESEDETENENEEHTKTTNDLEN